MEALAIYIIILLGATCGALVAATIAMVRTYINK